MFGLLKEGMNALKDNVDLGGYFSGEQGIIPDWGGVSTSETLGLDGDKVTDLYSQNNATSILSGTDTNISPTVKPTVVPPVVDNKTLSILDKEDEVDVDSVINDEKNVNPLKIASKNDNVISDDYDPWEDENEFGMTKEEQNRYNEDLMNTYGTLDKSKIKDFNEAASDASGGDVDKHMTEDGRGMKQITRDKVLGGMGKGLMSIGQNMAPAYQYKGIGDTDGIVY